MGDGRWQMGENLTISHLSIFNELFNVFFIYQSKGMQAGAIQTKERNAHIVVIEAKSEAHPSVTPQ